MTLELESTENERERKVYLCIYILYINTIKVDTKNISENELNIRQNK